MIPGSRMNHPIGGSRLKLRASTLDGQAWVRRAMDARSPGRDKMRNDKNKAHRDQTGRGAVNALAAPPVPTAAQRKTMRQGLRILAKIIALTHLRRQAVRCGAIPETTNRERLRAAPHGPAPEGETSK